MQLEVSRVTNDAEHEAALQRLEQVWGANDGDALDELNILTMLVDNYERGRWPMPDDRDPIDIIKDAMEHAGHTRAHLVELLGSASRVSEILARKRALTLDMIRAISDAWGIPQSLLTPAYELQTDMVTFKIPKQTVVTRVRHVRGADDNGKFVTTFGNDGMPIASARKFDYEKRPVKGLVDVAFDNVAATSVHFEVKKPTRGAKAEGSMKSVATSVLQGATGKKRGSSVSTPGQLGTSRKSEA